MKKKPNLLFLMTDQHRTDHVGWSDHAKTETPHLDRIAEGTAFTNCLTSNPVCTPARCSLLTGRYSRQINMLTMSGDLSRDIPTYPQALQKAGYKTAGIGKFHWLQSWPWSVGRGEGVDLVALENEIKEYGFDTIWECSGKQLAFKNYCQYAQHLEEKGKLEAFRDHIEREGENCNFAEGVNFTGDPWPLSEEDYPDIVTTDKIIDWLDNETSEDQPFFVFGSLVSPHQPLDPPKRYLDQIPYEEIDDFIVGEGEEELTPQTKKKMWKLRRSYKAMVKMIDDQVGRILDKLEAMGELENTIILFVSDHGEMLGDHGRFQKSIHWHQSAIVPCAVRHPDFLTKQKINTPIEIIDLTATILHYAGLDPQEALSKSFPRHNDNIPCLSLDSIIEGKQNRIRDYAFCEHYGEWSMTQSDQFSFVRFHHGDDIDNKAELLFDRFNDPNECKNLAKDPEHEATLTWHRNRLLHTIETHPPVQSSWAPYGAKVK